VRRFGDAWLRATVVGGGLHGGASTAYTYEVALGVIGETRARIEVVAEADHARVALWIARDDTWRVIGVPIALADPAGAALPIRVVRGAPVDVLDAAGARVRIHDDGLRVIGNVPATVIANVWLAAPGDPPPQLDATMQHGWSPSLDPGRSYVQLQIGSEIRARPERDAPVLATAEAVDVLGAIVGDAGAFREVEIARPYATVRGFVWAAVATPTTMLPHTHGFGGGFGFGSSHSDRIDVPAGACLYDQIDGEVVGVQSEPSTRLGTKRVERSAWSLVHVSTAWSTASLYVRDTSDDPDHPAYESCTEPLHRR
jgi:hypothetical protein